MLSRTPRHLLRRSPRVTAAIQARRARTPAHDIELRHGAEDRDAGIASVAASSDDFMPRARAMVSALGAWEGTGEELRLLISPHVAPHHHNAWGALVRLALADGLLDRTGEERKMAVRTSHARMTKVYRRRAGTY